MKKVYRSLNKKKSSASREYQVINFLNTKATGASLASIIFHICTCLARQKYNDLLKSDQNTFESAFSLSWKETIYEDHLI